MFTAKQYRTKAAEYTDLLKAVSSPAETREFQELEQSFLMLAENEEWMENNRERTISAGADDSWYDVLLLRQEENALGSLGAPDPTQSTEVQTQIQQLFDDAGSKGGLFQTATLQGQIGRFLQKHKDEDFD